MNYYFSLLILTAWGMDVCEILDCHLLKLAQKGGKKLGEGSRFWDVIPRSCKSIQKHYTVNPFSKAGTWDWWSLQVLFLSRSVSFSWVNKTFVTHLSWIHVLLIPHPLTHTHLGSPLHCWYFALLHVCCKTSQFRISKWKKNMYHYSSVCTLHMGNTVGSHSYWSTCT